MAVIKANQHLYRIMDFARIVQIFERKELYFANPSTWDDPYEELIKHSKNHALFGQCWSESATSDALWRIYSSNGMGVRISTTLERLSAVIRPAVSENGYKYRIKKVSYVSQRELDKTAKEVAASLNDFFLIGEAVNMLYVKRNAFSHENEWRATLYCPSEVSAHGKKGITIPVEPHDFINQILLDPRAPEELVEAFKFYFKNKLGFKGRVARSVLYQKPKYHKVDDDVLSLDDI